MLPLVVLTNLIFVSDVQLYFFPPLSFSQMGEVINTLCGYKTLSEQVRAAAQMLTSVTPTCCFRSHRLSWFY